MWGEIMETINKNEIKQGNVVDLTHEGHGVIKIDRYPIFAVSYTHLTLPTKA